MSTLFAFLHHAAAVLLISALAVEFAGIRLDLTLKSAKSIRFADATFGAAAAALLAIGGLRVWLFEKGAGYYFSSPAFFAKMVLFVAVGLLSVIPTLEFLSWRPHLKRGQLPAPSARKIAQLKTVISLEAAGIVLIVLFAALMSRGGWI